MISVLKNNIHKTSLRTEEKLNSVGDMSMLCCMRKNQRMKSILFLITLVTANTVFGQNEKRFNFFGVNPSVTVEPYYNSGELDINIFPLVYQRSISNRLDLRLTSILNYGIRNGTNQLSHIGTAVGIPFFFQKKEDKVEISKGFFVAPILSVTRNNEANHTNIGTWIEPGYNILFENEFALSLGLQIGGTYFINDSSANAWGNHFGVQVIFGKWF